MKKIKTFYLYRKIIISFLILNIISITIVSGVLSFIYLRTARKELSNYAITSLSRMDSSTARIYESLSPMINYILTSGYAAGFMELTEIDRVQEVRLLENLKGLGTANAQFKFVGVANVLTDRYLGTRGVYTGLEPEIKAAAAQEKRLYCMPRPVRKNQNIENSVVMDVLTFVYCPKGKYNNGLIVIDIDVRDFTDLLKNKLGEDDNEAIYIMDKSGRILINASPEAGITYEKLLSSDKNLLMSGNEVYYEKKMDGSVYSVAAISSSVSGWYFISLRPRPDILPMMKELIYVIVIAEVVMIAIDLLITLFLAQRVYKPLGSLYKKLQRVKETDNQEKVNEIEAFDNALEFYEKKNTSLEAYKDKTAYVISNYWLRGLARGEIRPEDTQIPENCIYLLPDGCYRVILLSFCNYDAYTQLYPPKDQEIIEFALGNIFDELLGSFCATHVVVTEKNCRMVVLKTENAEFPEQVFLGVSELQKKFMEYMNILINVCYGPCVGSWKEIPTSYRVAREGERKRLFLGQGCMIDAEFDYGRNKKYDYPHKHMKNISEAILLNNYQAAQFATDALLSRLSLMNVDDILNYSAQACYELAQKLSSNDSDLKTKSYQELFNVINKMEVIDEIHTFINHLITQIMEERKIGNSKNDVKDSILQAAAYIDGHYQEDNLCVELLADTVGLSPSYFGKLFNATMNQSCNDYIQEIRMKKASQLLKETGKTINEISVLVGINNTNYFYILFKKKYGMTPAQYRKSLRGESE